MTMRKATLRDVLRAFQLVIDQPGMAINTFLAEVQSWLAMPDAGFNTGATDGTYTIEAINRPRVVTFDDMIAFMRVTLADDEAGEQWWQNRLAETAAIPDRTSNTSASYVSPGRTTEPCIDKSGDVAAAATTTPPSAGTTGSGAGSVAEAVEALRVAQQGWRDSRGKAVDIIELDEAIDALLALDVPGMLKAAESEAAKLREDIAEAKKDAHYAAVRELVEALNAHAHGILSIDTSRALIKKHGGAA